jgi:hypothetical protein
MQYIGGMKFCIYVNTILGLGFTLLLAISTYQYLQSPGPILNETPEDLIVMFLLIVIPILLFTCVFKLKAYEKKIKLERENNQFLN